MKRGREKGLGGVGVVGERKKKGKEKGRRRGEGRGGGGEREREKEEEKSKGDENNEREKKGVKKEVEKGERKRRWGLKGGVSDMRFDYMCLIESKFVSRTGNAVPINADALFASFDLVRSRVFGLGLGARCVKLQVYKMPSLISGAKRGFPNDGFGRGWLRKRAIE